MSKEPPKEPPKVTLKIDHAAKPSDEVIASALTEYDVVDAKTRVIKLRKPGVLTQYRLVETLGQTASNAVYMRMVLPLIYVVSIDGDPVNAKTKVQIEALIQRLDEEGIKAVMDGVNTHFGEADPEADKESLKK